MHGAHDQFGDFDDDLDMNDEMSAPARVRSLLFSVAHLPLAYPLPTPTPLISVARSAARQIFKLCRWAYATFTPPPSVPLPPSAALNTCFRAMPELLHHPFIPYYANLLSKTLHTLPCHSITTVTHTCYPKLHTRSHVTSSPHSLKPAIA